MATKGEMMEDIGESVVGFARPLRVGATALEVVAIIGALGGVIGGIALATHTEATSVSGLFSDSSTTTHPWVAAGISVIAGALLVGLFNWCIARALALFAVHVAASYGVSIAPIAGVSAGPPGTHPAPADGFPLPDTGDSASPSVSPPPPGAP